MRILFAWRKYDQVVGGVERMSIALMNEMARRGHDVFLLSWDREGATPYYEMDPRITWHKLDSGNPDRRAGWGVRIKRALKIRRFMKKSRPDIVLAFMDGVFLSVKLATLGLGVPAVEAERCSASRFKYLESGRYVGLIFQSLRLAKRITVQLESYRKDYPAYLRNRIVSIPNPVFQAEGHANPGGVPGQVKILLSIGRLSYQKNYTVLIKAFAALAPEFPEWTLKIVGDGEEKDVLINLVRDLGIKNRVEIMGAVKDVKALYGAAHLFCLPSRWEGFPNALAEALAHGLPAVGFAGCPGVSDLIGEGINGMLARGSDNQDALAEALRSLMTDDKKRMRCGHAAVKSMEPYKPEAIFDAWERFFLQTRR